jgi:hypothetical protein
MKEVYSRFKNLGAAGIVMASCPHRSVIDTVDMCEGETFRHTLIPHLKLRKMNCKFLVNDVICKYWPFAQFLAKELIGEYSNLTHTKIFISSSWSGSWLRLPYFFNLESGKKEQVLSLAKSRNKFSASFLD